MPELPEVETIVRTLRPDILQRSIVAVESIAASSLSFGKEYSALLHGAVITDVTRRGKLLVLTTQTPQCAPVFIVFHLKMTGRLQVYPAGTVAAKHTRICIQLVQQQEKSILFFDDVRRFGYCRIMTAKDLQEWDFWQKLGPEPLDMTFREFCLCLGQRTGTIKSLLLNQQIIAGIGNIYADEACFRAGVHPKASAAALSQTTKERLLVAIQSVLEESIEACGSSIRDYRDAQGNVGAFQNQFYVYGRAGQACKLCAEPLLQAKVAGRTTVYCVQCQLV